MLKSTKELDYLWRKWKNNNFINDKDFSITGFFCIALDHILHSIQWFPVHLFYKRIGEAKFFKTLADGRTTYADAFDAADEHIDVTNFFSIWILKYWGDDQQDGKLDDNGDGIGSDYPLSQREDGKLARITGL